MTKLDTLRLRYAYAVVARDTFLVAAKGDSLAEKSTRKALNARVASTMRQYQELLDASGVLDDPELHETCAFAWENSIHLAHALSADPSVLRWMDDQQTDRITDAMEAEF